MNSNPSPHVRLSCRVVRRWSSLVRQTPPRHAEACADCRAYFGAGDALDAALRREASSWTRTAPAPAADFERSLIRSIREAAVASPKIGDTWSGWRTIGAVCAAGAVIAGLGYFQFSDGGSRRAPVDASLAADTALVVDAVESLSQGLMETVIPSAGALVADNPLQREFDSIYADARSALGFLAMNFLPAVKENVAAVPTRRI